MKLSIRLLVLVLALAAIALAADFESAIPAPVERPWIGPEYWSNPLQDWRIRDGLIEWPHSATCVSGISTAGRSATGCATSPPSLCWKITTKTGAYTVRFGEPGKDFRELTGLQAGPSESADPVVVKF